MKIKHLNTKYLPFTEARSNSMSSYALPFRNTICFILREWLLNPNFRESSSNRESSVGPERKSYHNYHIKFNLIMQKYTSPSKRHSNNY